MTSQYMKMCATTTRVANGQTRSGEDMRGLNVFAWVSAFVVAFLIVVFVVFSIIIANVLETDPIKIPSEVEALAAVFALIFGTAAVAGGAIATIKVASLGIEIYERQEYLEKTQFVETRVKPSIDRYSNLVLALSDTHAAAIALREYIKGWVPKLDNTGKKYDENQDLPPMLLMSVETFTATLERIKWERYGISYLTSLHIIVLRNL